MLEIKNLTAGYGMLTILHDMNFVVRDGEFVALVGQNGAGKTTTLHSISGLIKPKSGEIIFNGTHLESMQAYKIAQQGISYVTDNGNLFSGMTVFENIKLGAYYEKDKNKIKDRMQYVFNLFPRLSERKNQYAETLSGGERRMLSIARGLMASPSLMLVDEPSLGLAPNLVEQVFESLKTLSKEGITILLVEQNVNTTLKMVERAYVLDLGIIVKEGPAEDIRTDPEIMETYLGM
jgi:branched-chain amino acid transport system ATP-binding protein